MRWAIWSVRPLAHFRLFSSQRGQNWLAWVHAANIHFADVTHPRDRVTALTERLSGKSPSRFAYVPAGDIVPMDEPWGVDAFNLEINIVCIAKDEAGNFAIEIANPKGEEFTIVGDGENWHRE